MSGLEALQESIDPLHQSHLASAPARHFRNKFGIREKKMVELSPLTVDMKKEAGAKRDCFQNQNVPSQQIALQ